MTPSSRCRRPWSGRSGIASARPVFVTRWGNDPGALSVIKKRSPRLAAKLSEEIFEALDAQTVTLPAEATWGEVITDLLDDLERARRAEETTIEEVFLSHPLGQVLVTLCGFGPRTGARTLAEIGDPHRFETGSRLAAYAGLAPTDWRSGRSINGAFQHRGGNHRLKNAMFIAAFVATQFDPSAKAYYQRGGETPQRRRHLRRPPPLRPHPRHAQEPDTLRRQPAPRHPDRRLTPRQEHPSDTIELPAARCNERSGVSEGCVDSDVLFGSQRLPWSR